MKEATRHKHIYREHWTPYHSLEPHLNLRSNSRKVSVDPGEGSGHCTAWGGVRSVWSLGGVSVEPGERHPTDLADKSDSLFKPSHSSQQQIAFCLATLWSQTHPEYHSARILCHQRDYVSLQKSLGRMAEVTHTSQSTVNEWFKTKIYSFRASNARMWRSAHPWCTPSSRSALNWEACRWGLWTEQSWRPWYRSWSNRLTSIQSPDSFPI